MDRDTVAIFRLQLFKPSETFITAQADSLSRYSPLYVGRRLFGNTRGRPVVLPDNTSSDNVAGNLGMQLLRAPGKLVDGLRAARVEPALVHAHFGIDGVYAAPLSARLGVPLITTLHGFDVTRSDLDMLCSGRPALVNGVLFRRQLQKTGAMFICVSEFIRKAALRRGYPESKLRVHYIGIDAARVSPREHMGESGLILHVARLVQKKGTDHLLKAFSRILPERPESELVVIGDGPLRPALELEAGRLGIAERVRFLGALPNEEVLKWDARAAIKVVPSITAADGDQEGLPIVILEAGALGVPVVAYASGGIGEGIVHGETGLVAPEGDIDALAANLSLLLADRQLRLQMGRAARAHVEARFDIKKQTDRLERIYDQVRHGIEQ